MYKKLDEKTLDLILESGIRSIVSALIVHAQDH